MAIFHCYVSSPEGKNIWETQLKMFDQRNIHATFFGEEVNVRVANELDKKIGGQICELFVGRWPQKSP